MRNTDPTEPERFQPFGPKVEKPKPEPTPSKPRGPYGIVEVDGKLKTTRDNLPPFSRSNP
jgi:hypothetical protein